MRKDQWEGQIKNIPMEYDVSKGTHTAVKTTVFETVACGEEIPIDKIDCLVAASSGLLTAMLDVLWVGEFSLRYAQEIGTQQINNLVIAIARKDALTKGKRCPENELKSCIKYLEKEYPLAADKLINEFGGGLQHHLRDFSHHASPFGLMCSILNQFTEHGYGTDTNGNFIKPKIPETETIGTTLEDKITLGVVSWFFHLVSDMAGSSSSTGRGTGIPGPILSLAKVLSATPMFKELRIRYKNNDIAFSVWISKLFNGAAFEHTSHKDVIRFDLRTEIGIANFAVKQAIPILLNQCIVRSFYFVRRLAQDFSEKNILSLSDLNRLDAKRFLPFNNRTITHMITISTGVFSVVDVADAGICARIKNPNDTAKAISDTLLRLNFVGIGAFAISVKNEISYVVKDIKKLGSKKTKAQQLLEKRYSQADIAKHIDVEVVMDNRNLYEYTFADLGNMVALSRQKLLSVHSQAETSIGKIFNLGEGNYSAHKSIVESNESRAIKTIEKLVVKMCEQNNIPFEYYPTDSRFEKCYYSTQESSRPFQMVRIEDGKRIGYIFCCGADPNVLANTYLGGAYDIEGIKIVRLNAPDQDAYKLLYEMPNKVFSQQGILARIITLQELFDDLFGEKEYPVFAEYANKFNSKAKEIIGFNTVLAPTDTAIARFREKIGEFLSTYPYKQYIPADIYQSQVKILLRNYLDRKLWRAMVGTADFAVSFISSEWNYHAYQLTDNLDMTGIVAGYLKSIEQLLFSIFSISEDKGISIKSRDGSIVDFSVENESQIDSTLGSLEVAIKHNGHILDVSPYMKRYLADTIGEWRNDQRNGHFHKHNLRSIEKVEEIRHKAIYLYFLILGSCTIRDDQFEKLGIVVAADNNAFSYINFVSWLELILKYGLPKETVAVCFALYDTEDGIWSMQLHGLKTFDEKVPYYEWKDCYNSGHLAYKWDRDVTEKEATIMIAKAVSEYMENGNCKESLSAYRAVAVACRFHTEFAYRQ